MAPHTNLSLPGVENMAGVRHRIVERRQGTNLHKDDMELVYRGPHEKLSVIGQHDDL
jgi:hypothetical protein